MPPLDLEWTEEERELLRSAELDAPPQAGPQRTLAALGITGALVGGAVVSGSAQAAQVAVQGSSLSVTASTGAKSLLVAKWLMLVALGGGAGGAALYYRASTATKPPANAPAAPQVAKAAARPALATAPLPAESNPVPEVEKAVPAPPKTTPAPLTSRGEPDLALEIESLDRARRASQSGNFALALSELDRYDGQFKQGRLRQEAWLLRVQTLMGKGDTAAARALGERFLARYPKSPLSPRIQKLIGVTP